MFCNAAGSTRERSGAESHKCRKWEREGGCQKPTCMGRLCTNEIVLMQDRKGPPRESSTVKWPIADLAAPSDVATKETPKACARRQNEGNISRNVMKESSNDASIMLGKVRYKS